MTPPSSAAPGAPSSATPGTLSSASPGAPSSAAPGAPSATPGALSSEAAGSRPKGREGIEPVRDPRVTLVELVDTLLDRGLYLNLDVIISVADIPLIGLNLRATLAGMETMLEYGMMRDWDQRTRAWVQRTAARDLPLEGDEELVAKMPGGYFSDDGFHRDWRPGGVYLTTHRVIVFRRDPRQVLWQAPLESIRTVGVRSETTIGGERLDRLHLVVDQDQDAVLSASTPSRLQELILAQAPTARRASALQPGPEDQDADGSAPTGTEGHLWYREELAGRPQWRGGTARLDARGFTWKSATDARPAIRIAPGDLRAVRTGDQHAPFDDVTVMVLETASEEVVLAGDASRWEPALGALTPQGRAAERSPHHARGRGPDPDQAKEAGNGPADR